MENVSRESREEAADKILETVKSCIPSILKNATLSQKLEKLVTYLSRRTLRLVRSHVSPDSIFNKNVSRLAEKALASIRQKKEEGGTVDEEEEREDEEFVQKVKAYILAKIEKAVRSKASNHVIRELLRIKEHAADIAACIREMDINVFLADTTRINTYASYLDAVAAPEREKCIDALLDILVPNMLRDYHAFLYEKICRTGTREQLERVYEKIGAYVPELAKDPVGNYFVQTLISVYDPVPIFFSLRQVLGSFSGNSNIIFSLVERGCVLSSGMRTGHFLTPKKEKEYAAKITEMIEYIVDNVLGMDGLMQRLICHSAGGLDSKGCRLAALLLSVTTRYLGDLQLQCIAAYERAWLSSKTGQKLVVHLIKSRLPKEIEAIFVGTLKKEIPGLAASKGGAEILEVLGRALKGADRDTRRTIRQCLERRQTGKAADNIR